MLCMIAVNKNSIAQAGSLDLSFGTTGKVATALSTTGHSYGTASAIQSDGKIVAAGYAYFGNNIDFALSRYNTDGSLDLNFDGDGKVTTDLGNMSDYCFGIAIQNDGKILLSGTTDNYTKIAIVRYNSNGSIDSTFDTDGILKYAVGTTLNEGYGIATQNDGKIIVSGSSFSGANFDFFVTRLNTNGSFDLTFDTDGIVETNIIGDDFANAITLQNDGKIILAGSSNMQNAFSLVRYNTDGSLDITFDTDGKVSTATTNGLNWATCLAIQSDGKIVLAGNSNISGNVNVLTRYNTNGSLDLSFDTDGIVLTANLCNNVKGVKIANDGKIIVVGSYGIGSNMDFVVERYNTNGILDSTFDTDGVVNTDLGFGTDDFAYATSIQNDGKIVVVGHGNNTGFNNFMVVRYNPGIATSINNTVESTIHNIYPNPTKGMLYIPNQKKEYSVKIFNSMGQELYYEMCNANQSSINFENLPAGIYLFQLQNNTETFTTGFVKE